MKKTFTALLPEELIDFASAYAQRLFECRSQALELVQSDETKTKQSQKLQGFGLNKRQANSLLIETKGKVDSAIECRALHLKTLEGKINSAKNQIQKWQRQLDKLAYPCCDLRRNQWKTVQHRLRFKLHHKRRYLIERQRKLEALRNNPLSVNLGPVNNFALVGSQGETGGNQICQYNGSTLKIRVPYALEENFGKYVGADLTFPYGQDVVEAALLRRAVNSKSGEVIPAGLGEALTVANLSETRPLVYCCDGRCHSCPHSV